MKKIQKHVSLVKRKPLVKNQLVLNACKKKNNKKTTKNAIVLFAPKPSIVIRQIDISNILAQVCRIGSTSLIY